MNRATTRREAVAPAAVPANPSRDGHWFFVHQRALRKLPQMNGLTVLDHRVLDALVTCADSEGRARPGMREIAAMCGNAPLGRVQESIKAHERRGLIRRECGDRTRANRYHLWPFVGAVGCGTPVFHTVWDSGVPRNTHVTPPGNRTPSVCRLGDLRSSNYELRVATGLRPSEAARLRWCDVTKDAQGRYEVRVHVPVGERTKQARSQHADVPLPADVAVRLLTLRPGGEGDAAPVFRLQGYSRSAAPTMRTFKDDLTAAGIEYEDAEGRVVDRYALRRTFNRRLIAAGTDPRVASRLMRHASMDTTMASYTDTHLLDLHGAAECGDVRDRLWGKPRRYRCHQRA